MLVVEQIKELRTSLIILKDETVKAQVYDFYLHLLMQRKEYFSGSKNSFAIVLHEAMKDDDKDVLKWILKQKTKEIKRLEGEIPYTHGLFKKSDIYAKIAAIYFEMHDYSNAVNNYSLAILTMDDKSFIGFSASVRSGSYCFRGLAHYYNNNLTDATKDFNFVLSKCKELKLDEINNFQDIELLAFYSLCQIKFDKNAIRHVNNDLIDLMNFINESPVPTDSNKIFDKLFKHQMIELALRSDATPELKQLVQQRLVKIANGNLSAAKHCKFYIGLFNKDGLFLDNSKILHTILEQAKKDKIILHNLNSYYYRLVQTNVANQQFSQTDIFVGLQIRPQAVTTTVEANQDSPTADAELTIDMLECDDEVIHDDTKESAFSFMR
jgi:hypothetical protein